MKQALIIGAILLVGYPSFGQQKIRIEAEQSDANYLSKIGDFYFVHHTFADAFFMTDLYKQLSYDQMVMILKAVNGGVTQKDKVTIIVDQESEPEARLVFFIKNHPENGETLIMMTNFNTQTRKFTANLDAENSLTRWYFIRGDKLVYRKDLFSKSEERKKKKQAPHKLIDYYLLDDNRENDAKVKPLIDDLIKSDANSKEILYGKLYLGEYWLQKGDMEKAGQSVEDLADYFNSQSDIPKGFKLIVDMATAEFEILKRIKN